MQANRINKYLGIFLLTLGLWVLSCKKKDAEINCTDYPRSADAYVFPIVPGTPEWNNLKSNQRLEACQIPAEKASKISTEGLIQSWMDYPLKNEIFYLNNFQIGIEYFLKNFSGLAELNRRNDAGAKLFERYKKMKPECITGIKNPMELGNFPLDFTYIEMIIAQDIILDKLSLSEKKQLASESINKFDAKKRLESYHGSLAAGTALFVGMKAMKAANYAPFLQELTSQNALFLNTFLSTAIIPTNNLNAKEINVILNHLRNFIK